MQWQEETSSPSLPFKTSPLAASENFMPIKLFPQARFHHCLFVLFNQSPHQLWPFQHFSKLSSWQKGTDPQRQEAKCKRAGIFTIASCSFSVCRLSPLSRELFSQCLWMKWSPSPLPGSVSRSTECLWHPTLFASNSFHIVPSVLNTAKYLFHFRGGEESTLLFCTIIAGDELVSESKIHALSSAGSYSSMITFKPHIREWCHRLPSAARLKSTNYHGGEDGRRAKQMRHDFCIAFHTGLLFTKLVIHGWVPSE